MAGSSRTYGLLLVFGLLSVLLSFYGDIRKRERLVEMNYHTLSSQYGALHEMYREKRRQFHDVCASIILSWTGIYDPERLKPPKSMWTLMTDCWKSKAAAGNFMWQ